MRITLRPALLTLIAAGVPLVSSACINSVSNADCSAVSNVPASMSGDTVITTTGLKYRELTVGTGTAVESVAQCQNVELRYTGKLLNGTVFSQTQGAETVTFTVGEGRLIPGFEQGLIGIRVGGRREMIIPPNLAYGATPQTDNNGNVVIPANSTIIFDVTVVAVDR